MQTAKTMVKPAAAIEGLLMYLWVDTSACICTYGSRTATCTTLDHSPMLHQSRRPGKAFPISSISSTRSRIEFAQTALKSVDAVLLGGEPLARCAMICGPARKLAAGTAAIATCASMLL